MMSLIEKGLLSFKDLVYMEAGAAESENPPIVEAFYHLMAILLKLHYDKTKSWSEVAAVFKQTQDKFYDLQSLLLENVDNMKAEISGNIGADAASHILPLIIK